MHTSPRGVQQDGVHYTQVLPLSVLYTPFSYLVVMAHLHVLVPCLVSTAQLLSIRCATHVQDSTCRYKWGVHHTLLCIIMCITHHSPSNSGNGTHWVLHYMCFAYLTVAQSLSFIQIFVLNRLSSTLLSHWCIRNCWSTLVGTLMQTYSPLASMLSSTLRHGRSHQFWSGAVKRKVRDSAQHFC